MVGIIIPGVSMEASVVILDTMAYTDMDMDTHIMDSVAITVTEEVETGMVAAETEMTKELDVKLAIIMVVLV